MKGKQEILYNRLSYLILLFIATLYIVTFSEASSPFTAGYPMDSTIFMTMGRMFLEGKVPFVDFFDHKGPSLILIEAISQLIAPYRTGLFILEILNLFLVLLFIWKSASLILNKKESLVVASFLLVFTKYVFSGGNSTEEYSLLYNFICLYIFCRSFFLNEKITKKNALIIGLCFSFLFWLRPNNALPIVAICIYLFFNYIKLKDYKTLKILIVYFLIGQIPFTTLYITYFSYHNAVYDLLYASFIFNLAYIKSSIGFSDNFIWINYLSVLLVIGGSSIYSFKTKSTNSLIFSLLLLVSCTLASNIGGGAMDHYCINMNVVLIWSCILIFAGINNKRISVILITIGLIATIRLFYYGLDWLLVTREKKIEMVERKKESYESIFNLIPQNEKNYLFFYDALPEVYPILNITPNYKYFVLQEWHGKHDKGIFDEINKLMQTNPPIWICLLYPYTAENRYTNEVFIHILETKYIIRQETDALTLLKYAPNGLEEYPKFRLEEKD